MQGRLKRSYRVAAELSRNDEFEGTIALTEFDRLAQQALASEGQAAASFAFGRSEFGHPLIRGQVQASVTVECQRCLEPMALALDQKFELLIDADDEAIESCALDSVYTQDGYLDVFALMEDELLLALPIVQMHDDQSCNKYWQPEAEAEPPTVADNPFAVLNALKGTD
jgi:uncharacterized protein